MCVYLADEQVNIGSGNGLVSSTNNPLPGMTTTPLLFAMAQSFDVF